MTEPDARLSEVVPIRCEYTTPSRCRNDAVGYVGVLAQHPLCDEHLKPKYHPPDQHRKLQRGEITKPCDHILTERGVR